MSKAVLPVLALFFRKVFSHSSSNANFFKVEAIGISTGEKKLIFLR
jgi:hypothetical protein